MNLLLIQGDYENMFLPEFENQERKRTNITYSAYIKSA